MPGRASKPKSPLQRQPENGKSGRGRGEMKGERKREKARAKPKKEEKRFSNFPQTFPARV